MTPDDFGEVLRLLEPTVTRIVARKHDKERDAIVQAVIRGVMPLLDERLAQLMDEEIAPLRRKVAALEMDLHAN